MVLLAFVWFTSGCFVLIFVDGVFALLDYVFCSLLVFCWWFGLLIWYFVV